VRRSQASACRRPALYQRGLFKSSAFACGGWKLFGRAISRQLKKTLFYFGWTQLFPRAS
jgi:hypothetical protein